MSNRRDLTRVKCTTVACWNRDQLIRKGDWQENDYCRYIKVECPVCLAKYWLVDRENRFDLKDRTDKEKFFENRKLNRNS